MDAALDITVVNPLQVTGAAATPGHALDYRYRTKMEGAAEECRQQGIKFLPVVVERLGGWHREAENQVKKLAVTNARHSGEEEEEALKHPFTRLSILVMRGNAAILSSRIPNFTPANVDGIRQSITIPVCL